MGETSPASSGPVETGERARRLCHRIAPRRKTNANPEIAYPQTAHTHGPKRTTPPLPSDHTMVVPQGDDRAGRPFRDQPFSKGSARETQPRTPGGAEVLQGAPRADGGLPGEARNPSGPDPEPALPGEDRLQVSGTGGGGLGPRCRQGGGMELSAQPVEDGGGGGERQADGQSGDRRPATGPAPPRLPGAPGWCRAETSGAITPSTPQPKKTA